MIKTYNPNVYIFNKITIQNRNTRCVFISSYPRMQYEPQSCLLVAYNFSKH